MRMIESGGEIQEQALPDHGRIVIERIGITVEGTTPTIVFGIAVTGTVGSALVAIQPNGLVPGLCSMGTITVLIVIYFVTGDHGYPRITRTRKAPSKPTHSGRRKTKRRD